MKIIKKQTWKTIFLMETNFKLQTEKATYVELFDNKGIWISNKFVKFNEIGKDQKPYFGIVLNKDLTYKLFTHKEENNELEIGNTYTEMNGTKLIELFFNQIKGA